MFNYEKSVVKYVQRMKVFDYLRSVKSTAVGHTKGLGKNHSRTICEAKYRNEFVFGGKRK